MKFFDEIDTGVSGEIAIKMGRYKKRNESNHSIQMYHYPFGAFKVMHIWISLN
jgi:hypothetical protein